MFQGLPTSTENTAETSASLYSSAVPQETPLESISPRVDGCRCDVGVIVVPENPAAFGPQFTTVNLVATVSPQQAYKICIQTPPSKSIQFRGKCYAREFCAIRMCRAGANTEGCEPTIDEPIFNDFGERVSITVVNKRLLQECREEGMLDNPYKDIYRMQTMGDGIRIMECIEALQNRDFLFIVTPYVEHNLSDWIQAELGAVSEAKAQNLFRQMVDILKYLRENRILHGNLTPEKFVFYNGRLILKGFGMSLLVPDGVTLLSNTIGTSIQPSLYVSPEAYEMLPFHPYALDMWSSTVILFHTVTGGGKLYNRPTFNDPLFCYFLLARGISPSDNNIELRNEAFDEMGFLEQERLCELVEKYSLLSPELVELFDNALCVSVIARWSLDDVEACSWMNVLITPDSVPDF